MTRNKTTLSGGFIFGACGRIRTGDRWLWVRVNEQIEENGVPANAGTPFSLCRSAFRLCLIRLDHLAGAAAITPLVDAADEFIVDVHLLGLNTIRPDYLFMYHYFLNQFVEDVGRQLCNAGIFPDEGQELFDIFVDLITL